MRIFYYVVFTLVLCSSAFADAQEPQIVWERFFGGGVDDEGRRVFLTPDGGFAIMGRVSFGDSASMYLAETDSTGILLWEKVTTGRTRWLYDGCPVSSGGYLLAGYINNDYLPMQSNGDFYIWRTDALGNTQWTMEYGDKDLNEFLHSIDETSDGGCIGVGFTYPDTANNSSISLLKVDNLGNVEWERIYKFSEFGDIGWCVLEAPDGGYTIAAQCLQGTEQALRVFKVDTSGSVMWSCSLVVGSSNIEIKGMEHTDDGGYIAVGTLRTTEDIWLVKLDGNGQVEWQSFIGTDRPDNGQSVVQKADGGYLVAGFTHVSSSGDWDAYIAEVDSLGNKLWDQQFSTNVQDARVYAFGIVETSPGNCVFIGEYNAPTTIGEIWLVAVESQYGIEIEVSDSGLMVSNNPFNGVVLFTVTGDVVPEKLCVFDSTGRIVTSLNHSENGSFTWTPSENNPPGIYFVRGIAEDEDLCARVIRL